MAVSRYRPALAVLVGALALASMRPAHADGAPAPDPDPWLGRDKALHFGASAALVGASYTVTALATHDPGHRLGVSAAFAFSVGIGKEIADRYTGGDSSLRDLTWDAIGTASGLVVAWLLDRYVF